ncbi:MAG: hypothetical protein EZS28_048691, partial [Streblomastix strix]
MPQLKGFTAALILNFVRFGQIVRYVVVLDATNKKGDQILAIISPSDSGKGFAFVPTVYEKDNFNNLIQRTDKQGKILYIKEKGSGMWGRVQFSPRHNQNLNNNILTKEDIVNTYKQSAQNNKVAQNIAPDILPAAPSTLPEQATENNPLSEQGNNQNLLSQNYEEAAQNDAPKFRNVYIPKYHLTVRTDLQDAREIVYSTDTSALKQSKEFYVALGRLGESKADYSKSVFNQMFRSVQSVATNMIYNTATGLGNMMLEAKNIIKYDTGNHFTKSMQKGRFGKELKETYGRTTQEE